MVDRNARSDRGYPSSHRELRQFPATLFLQRKSHWHRDAADSNGLQRANFCYDAARAFMGVDNPHFRWFAYNDDVRFGELIAKLINHRAYTRTANLFVI